jgi:methylphosphotriester-DNA--protein-cysteine methyltransferase
MQVPEEFAGQKGRCKHCGHAFLVPPAEHETPLGVLPPERFGAYGKAADEHWDDPTVHAQEAHEAPVTLDTGGIPPAIMEKHRALKRQQTRRITMFAVAALLLLGLFLGLGLFLARARTEPAVTPPETPPAPVLAQPDLAPALAPPATVSPVDDGKSVYIIGGDTFYHRGQCVSGPAENSARQRLTPEQALAAGFAPCRECQPAGYESYYHVPLYERIGEPAAPASEPAESETPVPTVYVNPGETEVHMAGCEALRANRQLISLVDAHARGYTPCPRCMPE